MGGVPHIIMGYSATRILVPPMNEWGAAPPLTGPAGPRFTRLTVGEDSATAHAQTVCTQNIR